MNIQKDCSFAQNSERMSCWSTSLWCRCSVLIQQRIFGLRNTQSIRSISPILTNQSFNINMVSCLDQLLKRGKVQISVFDWNFIIEDNLVRKSIFCDKFVVSFIQQNKMGGVFLSQPNTAKKTNKYQHGKIRVVTCEMQGWRKYMEDAIVFHRISKEIFLFAVFDGHGGVEVSQFCAKNVAKLLEQNENFKEEKYKEALEETFQALDKLLDCEEGEKQLKNISIQNGMQPFEDGKVADSVGCTANVVLLVNKTVYVANAGDSRAALSRNGKIIELSFDHKPEDKPELERIQAAGYKVQNGRINNHLNLSRCLGDLHYKRNQHLSYARQPVTGFPDVKSIEICKQDDFIIMGCDGVWQRYQKNGQGLVDIIRTERLKGQQPQKVLQNMLDSFLGKDPTKQQLGCDNMSSVLIEFNKLAF